MNMPSKRKTASGRRGRTARRGGGPPTPEHGLVRARDLQAQGVSRVALRRMVDKGELRQLARGLYAPGEFEPTEHHGLAAAGALVPGGVVCLLSALQFHHLGTQAPYEVWLAIDRKAYKPAVVDPPLRIVRFSRAVLESGVESHTIEGVAVRITSKARTVADCFKYRNKIGLDVAVEALREYRRARGSIDELVHAAQSVRVANVMRPYLEAMVP
jgi:predicted transcriptional regulator of viral defense system